MTPQVDVHDGLVQLNYRAAIAEALSDEMSRDPRVVLLGEDIADAGGVFKTTVGLKERFGDRVRDTPISEQAIIGVAIGASLVGIRPVAEIMFADFAGVCYDQIANSLAKYRYMGGGQGSAPVTIRLTNGSSMGFGSQHSQAVENWFLSIPGLKIAVPATVEDLYGLLRSAIRDEDPVLVFEHKALFAVKGELPAESDARGLTPLGVASVAVPGDDITIVATQLMRHRAVEAAHNLSSLGISVEVVDPRCLVPFDFTTLEKSLEKTGRLLVVQEGPPSGGWGNMVIAHFATEHFDLLTAPPAMLSSDPIPIPYSAVLEDASIPSASQIEQEVLRMTSARRAKA